MSIEAFNGTKALALFQGIELDKLTRQLSSRDAEAMQLRAALAQKRKELTEHNRGELLAAKDMYRGAVAAVELWVADDKEKYRNAEARKAGVVIEEQKDPACQSARERLRLAEHRAETLANEIAEIEGQIASLSEGTWGLRNHIEAAVTIIQAAIAFDGPKFPTAIPLQAPGSMPPVYIIENPVGGKVA